MTDAATIPLRRTLPRLVWDPLTTFRRIGERHGGELVRLNLGLFRPYLVIRPEHVQHVLRDRPDVYRREGMLWRPLQRLEGTGVAGEGSQWAVSRHLFQPLFAGRNVDAMAARMAAAVEEAVDEWVPGSTVDIVEAMTRVVHRVLIRVFFGDLISTGEAERLGVAISRAFASLGARMLLPFAGDNVPLPGDRRFRRAVTVVDRIIYPHVYAGRRRTGAEDVVARLAAATDDHGRLLDDRWVRDDVVAMFVAGTETTALTLTWLWLLLADEPSIVERMCAEPSYPRMVLNEVLRLYPVGWIVPRTLAADDVLDGVRLRRGSTVLVSPYLTHRLTEHWEEPEEFRPERFTPGWERRRHRYSYLPFGAGPHQCLGSHFFLVEAQLVAKAVLSRYRPEVRHDGPVTPRAAATLRPRGRVAMTLHPI